MRILVVCDQGNNRSVTVAGQLKYWGHDVLTAGLDTNSPETLGQLCSWADRVITTAKDQVLPASGWAKAQLWDIGPDVYPRMYNAALLRKVKRLMKEHAEEYKS